MHLNSRLSLFSVNRSILALTLAAALLCGCTHTAKVRVNPVARVTAPAGTKIPLHVGLMLRGPYVNYSYKISRMGDTFVTPLGPALRQEAVSLCEQTFDRVTVSTNGVVPAGVDGVLTPDVHRLGYAWTLSRKLILTLLVEWTLRDAENRQVIWVTTVDGQAQDSEKKVFQQLFDDLTAKSYAAFRSSPEIPRLTGAAH